MRRSALALAFLCACSSDPSGGVAAADAAVPIVDADIDAGAPTAPPRVILFIGDGMGPVHADVASHFLHGASDMLELQTLGALAVIDTDSLSGLTDSAAAATAMATGELTINGQLAIDPAGAPIESIFETARARGLATGAVTTTSLPHATPAAFTAHEIDRDNLDGIAAQQLASGTEVLLGGGGQHFSALDPKAAGYQVVTTAAELAAIDPAAAARLFGTFAQGHLPYLALRPLTVPDLAAMTEAAIAILERDPDGFVLMVESGRIDHASHANLIGQATGEVVELENAVIAALSWAAAIDNATIAVVGDHETGGLAVVDYAPAGAISEVSWESGQHTDRPVHLTVSGDAGAAIDGRQLDLTAAYQVLHSAID